MLRPIPAVLLLGLLGCTTPAAQPETPRAARAAAPADTADTAAAEAPLWSREGVAAQPRMAAFQRQLPPELGYSPATAPWRRAPLELPPELASPPGAGSPSPDSLLAELIRELELAGPIGEEVWEQTRRIWRDGEDAAVAALLQWGLKDDAVAGQDLRIFMRRSNGRWYAERIEERFHCSRGVTEEDLCV